MSGLKHRLLVMGALAASGLLVSACATEEYVDQHVGAVKAEVDALNAKVDQHGQQIAQLQGSVQDAAKAAQDASAIAQQNKASIEQAAASRTIERHVISTDDSTKFETGSAKLSEEAKTSLTAFAKNLLAANQDVYVAIEGHADSTGMSGYNQRLSQRRAEATQQFLYTQGIDAHRISVIPLGEQKPMSPNDTAQGRTENRRVTLVVTGP